MNTILVPTDFSSTAKNAALYAIEFAKQTKAKKIILYHAYQQPVNIDPMMPTVQLLDMEELKRISEESLEHFAMQLKAFCNTGIQLETVSEFSLLAEEMDETCKKLAADIIIMGITGGSKLEEILIGSNTINVAEKTKLPVIIVPTEAKYIPISRVVLACDFKKVVETTPVTLLKKILDETKAKLSVLNIDHRQKHFTPDTPFESLMLDTLLQDYNPEYHFIDKEDFIEGVNEFVLEKQIELIITIPKKHGWFDNLFRRKHTKMLAYHTHIPLVVVHE